MTVVFDAEPLLAFSFDEPGAAAVERWLDRVYDGERDGFVSTVNLAEFRYVASREASTAEADAHIDDLRDMGLTEYGVDDCWKAVSNLKATYSVAIGDAYAVAAAEILSNDEERNVTLLVGADDDYDALEDEAEFEHRLERFRDDAA